MPGVVPSVPPPVATPLLGKSLSITFLIDLVADLNKLCIDSYLTYVFVELEAIHRMLSMLTGD